MTPIYFYQSTEKKNKTDKSYEKLKENLPATEQYSAISSDYWGSISWVWVEVTWDLHIGSEDKGVVLTPSVFPGGQH
jgi:hypothetical protein